MKVIGSKSDHAVSVFKLQSPHSSYVAIAEMTLLDGALLLVDVVVIAILGIYYFQQGNSFSKCRKIELKERDLKIWRTFLYTIIFSTWIIAFGIFVEPIPFKDILHPVIIIGMGKMFQISIPAYVCKKQGYGGTCNCDFYAYNDFYPMLAIATIGNLVYFFFNWNFTSGMIWAAVLLIMATIVFFLMPKRELEPLKYPPEMLISEIDSLQAFLMENPHQKKLLIVLDAKCDFCEIQVKELMQIPEDIRKAQLRIFDLTFVNEMDAYIPMTLNMNTDEKVPVPTCFVFDSGMVIEQRDGVLSKTDIETLILM